MIIEKRVERIADKNSDPIVRLRTQARLQLGVLFAELLRKKQLHSLFFFVEPGYGIFGIREGRRKSFSISFTDVAEGLVKNLARLRVRDLGSTEGQLPFGDEALHSSQEHPRPLARC